MFSVLRSVSTDFASFKSVVLISCTDDCRRAQARLLWNLHVVVRQHNNNDVIVSIRIFWSRLVIRFEQVSDEILQTSRL